MYSSVQSMTQVCSERVGFFVSFSSLGQEICLLSETSKPALWPTKPVVIRWVPGAKAAGA